MCRWSYPFSLTMPRKTLIGWLVPVLYRTHKQPLSITCQLQTDDSPIDFFSHFVRRIWILQCLLRIGRTKVFKMHLMRDRIELAKELTHGDGLGIDGPIDHFLLLVVASLVHEGQRVSKHMQYFGLPCKRLPNKHEPKVIQQTNKNQDLTTITCGIYRSLVK